MCERRQGGPLEFWLHRLRYVRLLTTEGRLPAVAYARAHFGAFRDGHMREIQRLSGAVLYADRLAASPYADLLSPKLWADAEALLRQASGGFCFGRW